MCRNFFRKQLVDEAGFHAVRLEIAIISLALITLLIGFLSFGLSLVSGIPYLMLLSIGFIGAVKRKKCLVLIFAVLSTLLLVSWFFSGVLMVASSFGEQNQVCKFAPTKDLQQNSDVYYMEPKSHKTPKTPTHKPEDREGSPLPGIPAEDPTTPTDINPPSPVTPVSDLHKPSPFCFEAPHTANKVCLKDPTKHAVPYGVCSHGKFKSAHGINWFLVLPFLAICSLVFTLKLFSIIHALRMARSLKCCRRREQLPVVVPVFAGAPNSQPYYSVPQEAPEVPMYYVPQIHVPVAPVEYTREEQIAQDEALALALQRQYNEGM